MPETIFTKIINKEIPADIVYEDDFCLAFRDINPQAPVHLLVIPKKPIETLKDAETADQEMMGRLLFVANVVAEKEGVGDAFRLVLNNGAGAGQEVPHLHLHVLAGRSFGWPPG
jgi:histidine triad (HIT) family protein